MFASNAYFEKCWSLLAFSVAGCDNPFESSDENGENGDDQTSEDDDDQDVVPAPLDGTLHVRIREATADWNPCSEPGEESVLLVWVFPAGSSPDGTCVGRGIKVFEDGEATAQIHNDGPHENPLSNPEWVGTGGTTYDVYPRVFCAADGDADNIDPGTDLPTRVYRRLNDGWGDPITYTQDGWKI